MALNPFKLFPSSPSPHFLDGTIGTYRNAALRKWKNTWLRKKRGVAWRGVYAVLHFGFAMSRLLDLLRVTASNPYKHFIHFYIRYINFWRVQPERQMPVISRSGFAAKVKLSSCCVHLRLFGMPCQEPIWTSQYNMSSSHLFLDQRLL